MLALLFPVLALAECAQWDRVSNTILDPVQQRKIGLADTKQSPWTAVTESKQPLAAVHAFTCVVDNRGQFYTPDNLSSPLSASPRRQRRAEAPKRHAKRPGQQMFQYFNGKFDVSGIVSKQFNVSSPVKVFNVTDEDDGTSEKVEETGQQTANGTASAKPPVPPGPTVESAGSETPDLSYRTSNPGDSTVLPPDETPQVRLEPDAPSPIRGMVGAMRAGDKKLSAAYADQFVRLQQNFFFELRAIVDQIGQAMVRQNVIDEDAWPLARDMLDYEMAVTRREMGEVLKPTHDVAMKRIKPDPKNEVDVLYFFSLSCSWCRYMAPDMERLYQMVKDDPKVNFKTYILGPASDDYLREYRAYTGLTAPVYEGAEAARALGVGFIPAVIVVSRSANHAYSKTGQQSFDRLYEFVRTVQGLPAVVNERFDYLAKIRIGEAERLAKGPASGVTVTQASGAKLAGKPQAEKVVIQKF